MADRVAPSIPESAVVSGLFATKNMQRTFDNGPDCGYVVGD